MDFIRIIVYLCLSTVLLAARVNRSDTKEPVCYSRYDYEIKMLREMASLEETEAHLTEKTVGLQNEVDGIKTEMKGLSNFLYIRIKSIIFIKRLLFDPEANTTFPYYRNYQNPSFKSP